MIQASGFEIAPKPSGLSYLKRRQHTLQADREPDALDRLIADVDPVPAAAGNRILSAKARMAHFPNRMNVVIETAHQPRVQLRRDGQQAQQAHYFIQILPRSVGHERGDRRQMIHHSPAVGIFAVEHSEHVRFEPPPAVLAQLVDVRPQRAPESFDNSLAVLRHPARVDLHAAVAKPPRGENVMLERDDFNIGRRARRAERLDPELMELPLSPCLRTLTTEHRAEVIESSIERLGALPRHVAHDTGGPFRAQGQASTAPVFERIHFFLNDVRRVAKRPGENLGILEDGRPDFGEMIERQNLAGFIFDSLPDGDFRRTEIGHALYGLGR